MTMSILKTATLPLLQCTKLVTNWIQSMNIFWKKFPWNSQAFSADDALLALMKP